MKLAILGTRGIPAQYGGFETFAEELAVRLVQHGVEVTVFCEQQAQPINHVLEYKGVKLCYVPVFRLGPLSTILFDLLCLWRARNSFNVVYMLGYGASLFCFLPRLWGHKVWINMDGVEWARSKWSWPAKLWLKMMEAVAMWTPSRIIADADGILKHLQQRYSHLPPSTFIPYGAKIIDLPPPESILEEWGLNTKSYLLVVCRLEPENHLLEILEGYRASEVNLPLIILGNYLAVNSYVKLLIGYSHPNIRFIGTIYNYDKLIALRYHSYAYLHGHSVGGTNPSLLEAMGCGNGIIAHDNQFNREVAGASALYFKDAASLSAILKNLRNMAANGKAAQQIIRERYTWNKIVTAYLELLEVHK
jgi:glycosyltransferase involved in cell wall biosynthesis